MMAICGTGMGSLAGLLKNKGFDVAGSDQGVYPPMSTELQKQNIPLFSPFNPQNIKDFNPDLVIVGNAISKTNPEAQYVLENDLSYVSMPQALKEFFLKEKDVIVVSGTHGKTTTTSLMAHLLNELDEDPSFLVGGVTQNFSKNFRIGSGKYFVIEGDEYDTAFFNKVPKFLHYHPKHVILTSVEFDHADIYKDLAEIQGRFAELIELIPSNGSLHFADTFKPLDEIVQKSKNNIFKRRYGTTSQEWSLNYFCDSITGSSFEIAFDNQVLKINSPLSGLYNAYNVAACFSVLQKLDLNLDEAQQALQKFKGVKRRQEVLFESQNAVVIDDFAHHPTAVEQTIQAIKNRYPNHKLVAIFEPRSNTSRTNVFQSEYNQAFHPADELILAPVNNPEKVKDGNILDVNEIATSFSSQESTSHTPSQTSDILNILKNYPQDKPHLFLFMSNGGFENLPHTWAEELKSR